MFACPVCIRGSMRRLACGLGCMCATGRHCVNASAAHTVADPAGEGQFLEIHPTSNRVAGTNGKKYALGFRPFKRRSETPALTAVPLCAVV